MRFNCDIFVRESIGVRSTTKFVYNRLMLHFTRQIYKCDQSIPNTLLVIQNVDGQKSNATEERRGQVYKGHLEYVLRACSGAASKQPAAHKPSVLGEIKLPDLDTIT